jgi:hypothetical protein
MTDSTPTLYTDAQGREWQYWPLSAANQMWSEVTCNQYGCNRPAAFVGIVDVLGDGVLYYDSAAAWCYFCMPRELMTPEAECMVRHAEWARRVTVDECIGLINQARDEAGDNQTVESVLTQLIVDIRDTTENREHKLEHSMLPPEYHTGRAHIPGMGYAVRPNSGIPEDGIALSLSCTSPAK